MIGWFELLCITLHILAQQLYYKKEAFEMVVNDKQLIGCLYPSLDLSKPFLAAFPTVTVCKFDCTKLRTVKT